MKSKSELGHGLALEYLLSENFLMMVMVMMVFMVNPQHTWITKDRSSEAAGFNLVLSPAPSLDELITCFSSNFKMFEE